MLFVFPQHVCYGSTLLSALESVVSASWKRPLRTPRANRTRYCLVAPWYFVYGRRNSSQSDQTGNYFLLPFENVWKMNVATQGS